MINVSHDDAIAGKLAKLWGAAWNQISPNKRQMLVAIWKELEDDSSRWNRARL